MPESIKIILGIFVVSFFATGLIYSYPLLGSRIFGSDYQISGRKYFATLLIVFIALLFGFYLLMGGLTFSGTGGLIEAIDRMPRSTPGTIGIFVIIVLIMTSFVSVALAYALLGRTRGFTRQYLLTVFIFSIVLIIVVIVVDKGWHSILRPDVLRTIGLTALVIYIAVYFTKRRYKNK